MTNIIEDIKQAIEKKEITTVELHNKALGSYAYNIEALKQIRQGLQENTRRLTSFINTLEEERTTLKNKQEDEEIFKVLTRMLWLLESLEYHDRAGFLDPLQELTGWIIDLIKHHSQDNKKKG